MHYIFKIGSNTAVYSWIHVECCFVCQGSAAFCLQINFLKSSKKCLTKEENVLVKGGKPSSICCSLYFFWNFIAGISVLTPKGRNHCLKRKYDWFFFSLLLYLILYFTFSSDYFNSENLPNRNFMCSEILTEKVLL